MKTTKKRILQMGLPIVLILSAAVILIFTFGVPLPEPGNYTSPAVIVDQDGAKHIVVVEKSAKKLFVIDSNEEIVMEYKFDDSLEDFSTPAIGDINDDGIDDIVVLGVKHAEPGDDLNVPGSVICYVLSVNYEADQIDELIAPIIHDGIYPNPMGEPTTPMLYDLDGDDYLEFTYAYAHLPDGVDIEDPENPEIKCAIKIYSRNYDGALIGSPFILEKKISEIEDVELISNLSVVNLPLGTTVILPPPMPQEQSLVSWWKFEEDLCIDSGPNENNNSLTNEGDDGGVKSVPGKCGNAADFNPIYEQYLHIDENQTGLHIAGDMTVACWVYQKSNVAANDIIARYPEADPTSMDYFFYIEGGNGKLKLWSGSSFAESNDSVPVGSWHHIAFTRSGDNVAFYIDGAIDLDPDQEPLILPTGTTVEDAVVFVGKHGANAYADIKLDELCIWNAALDSTEIKNIYDMQKECNGDDFVSDPLPASLDTGIVFTFNGAELHLITGVDTQDGDGVTDEWGVVDGFPIESMTPMSGPTVLDGDEIYFTDYNSDNQLMILMYDPSGQKLLEYVHPVVKYINEGGEEKIESDFFNWMPEQTPPPICDSDTVATICRWHSVDNPSVKLMDIVVCTLDGFEIGTPSLPYELVNRPFALDQPVKGPLEGLGLIFENVVISDEIVELVPYVEGVDYKTAAVADVDNDFKPDIVLSSTTGIDILSNPFLVGDFGPDPGDNYEKHWPTWGYNNTRTNRYDPDDFELGAHPPVIISSLPNSISVQNAPINLSIEAYDPDPYDVLFCEFSPEPGTTPDGTPLSNYFDPETQEFNWQTGEGDEGTYKLGFTVYDTNGDSDTKIVNIEVTAPSPPPPEEPIVHIFAISPDTNTNMLGGKIYTDDQTIWLDLGASNTTHYAFYEGEPVNLEWKEYVVSDGSLYAAFPHELSGDGEKIVNCRCVNAPDGDIENGPKTIADAFITITLDQADPQISITEIITDFDSYNPFEPPIGVTNFEDSITIKGTFIEANPWVINVQDQSGSWSGVSFTSTDESGGTFEGVVNLVEGPNSIKVRIFDKIPHLADADIVVDRKPKPDLYISKIYKFGPYFYSGEGVYKHVITVKINNATGVLWLGPTGPAPITEDLEVKCKAMVKNYKPIIWRWIDEDGEYHEREWGKIWLWWFGYKTLETQTVKVTWYVPPGKKTIEPGESVNIQFHILSDIIYETTYLEAEVDPGDKIDEKEVIFGFWTYHSNKKKLWLE